MKMFLKCGRKSAVHASFIPIILENETQFVALILRMMKPFISIFKFVSLIQEKGLPGLSPALGVRPSNGFGVAATLCRGVTPEKSEA